MLCVEVPQDNDLQWFYDVGLFLNIYIQKYGVFLKTIVLFIFSFNGFYFYF